MELGFAVELPPFDSPLCSDGAGLGIDVDALHGGEVDHEGTVLNRPAGDAMAATAHRDLEVVLAREIYGVHNISQAPTPSDQNRSLVDETVVHLPGFRVAVTSLGEELTGERPREVGDGLRES